MATKSVWIFNTTNYPWTFKFYDPTVSIFSRTRLDWILVPCCHQLGTSSHLFLLWLWTWFHILISGPFSRWYAIWCACPLLVFLCLNLHAGNCPGVSCFRAEFQQTLPWLTMTTTHQNCKDLPVQCSWCFALEFLYAACLPVSTFYVLMLYLSTSLDFSSSLTIKSVISHYLTSACLFPNHNYFQIIVQQLWPISLQLTLPYLFDL